ncbi:MAG: DUF1573 domain-containing protein [Cytophagales bacterium]|nr:DUF1573 domain-containing protein [Cytophagales bacterium]
MMRLVPLSTKILLSVVFLISSCTQGEKDSQENGSFVRDGEIKASYPPKDDLPEGTQSKIEWEKTSYDFGTVSTGDIVEYVFKFKNTGTDPLIFSNVSATCGCTVPEWPKHPIPPGESNQIKVVFNTAGKTGTQLKKISVVANTNPSISTLELKGEVQTPSL